MLCLYTFVVNRCSFSYIYCCCCGQVFSMQGVGILLCTLVLVTVSQTLGDDYNAQWRISLGMGGLPMVIAFYFRWKMHETDAWEKKKHVRVTMLLLIC